MVDIVDWQDTNILRREELAKFKVWAMTMGRYSPTTVERLQRRLRQLSKYLDLRSPSQSDILEFFAHEVQAGTKPVSLNAMRMALIAWLAFRNIEFEIPSFKQPPSPDPWIPTDEEVLKILKTAEKYSLDKSKAFRAKVMAEILLFGGIRIGEMVRINTDDIREGGIWIRSEKGEAERIIGMPARIIQDINEYIHHYREGANQPALLTSGGKRMSIPYARKLVKTLGQRAGVPRFRAHAALHWCATSLLKGIFGQTPLDIRMVQIHLGHLSLRSTQRYTHVTQEEVAKEVRARLAGFFRCDTIDEKETLKIETAILILNRIRTFTERAWWDSNPRPLA